MKYQTIDGTIYILETLSEEEKTLFERMYEHSLKTDVHYALVEQSYHREIIKKGEQALGANWQEYPLYKINLDLLGRVAVRTGWAKQSEPS